MVSQPDRRRGRGGHASPSPISQRALAAGLALLRPERVAEPEAIQALRERTPDLGVVVAFGQFLPKSVRELPSLGYCINAHASLLPRYRGAAPVARALLAGERETGVSVMRVERGMDTGPVALVRVLPIGEDEDRGGLEARLAALAAEAIAEAVELAAAGRLRFTPQDDAAASLAPKLEREELRIARSEGAAAVANRVRALAPAPGATTTLDGEPLRILAARPEPGPGDAAPGRVRIGPDGALRVACGDGWLAPLRVQRAGGRAMSLEAFLRGHPIPDGTLLGG